MLEVIDEIKKYYDIKVQDNNILLDKKENLDLNKCEIGNLLQKLKRHKKSVLKLIANPPKIYKDTVAVDIETSALKPREGEIKLISVYGKNIEVVTEDIDEVAYILSDESILKVFHNASFDVTWLMNKGYKVNSYTDTMIMSQVINNHSKGGNKLSYLAKKYLNIDLEKELQGVENWRQEISQAHRDYCLRDSKITLELYHRLLKVIEERGLHSVLRREIDALPALIDLQENGIKFDYDGWQEVLDSMEVESQQILEAVREELDDPHLNLLSPAQIIQGLRKKEIEIEGTSDEVLAKYEGEIEVISLIRKYKKLRKQINSFGEKIKNLLDEDSRLRGSWRLIGTDTSRMTCKNPNLQGMPKESKKYFIPEEDSSFIIADYSNIELRILAEITKDSGLLMPFINGEDLHSKTTRIVLDKSEDDAISDEERKIGKVVNFGLVYGMTKYGLRKKLNAKGNKNISLEEADEFRLRYFKGYKGVLDYQDRMLKSEYIESLGGRYWSKDTSELPKGGISRFNYPIQASGAEGLKEALALLYKRKKDSWRLVAVVHDEIILEVPDVDIEEASTMLKSVMIEGMKQIVKVTPIEVDLKIGKYWVK